MEPKCPVTHTSLELPKEVGAWGEKERKRKKRKTSIFFTQGAERAEAAWAHIC